MDIINRCYTDIDQSLRSYKEQNNKSEYKNILSTAFYTFILIDAYVQTFIFRFFQVSFDRSK